MGGIVAKYAEKKCGVSLACPDGCIQNSFFAPKAITFNKLDLAGIVFQQQNITVEEDSIDLFQAVNTTGGALLSTSYTEMVGITIPREKLSKIYIVGVADYYTWDDEIYTKLEKGIVAEFIAPTVTVVNRANIGIVYTVPYGKGSYYFNLKAKASTPYCLYDNAVITAMVIQ